VIKNLFQQLVDEVRQLERHGDPIGISIREVKILIDHLADKSLCGESNDH
jgi:hypothetical protein